MSSFLPVVQSAAMSLLVGGGLPPLQQKTPMLQPPTSFVNFALATAPATIAAPAMAASDAGGGVVDQVIGVVFGGACLLLLAFIGNFALKAAGTLTENGLDISKRLEEAGVSKGESVQTNEPIYDTSFADDLEKMAAPVKKRSKDQLVTDEEVSHA